jgi:DNA-binding CsgD family transcriptional regulator
MVALGNAAEHGSKGGVLQRREGRAVSEAGQEDAMIGLPGGTAEQGRKARRRAEPHSAEEADCAGDQARAAAETEKEEEGSNTDAEGSETDAESGVEGVEAGVERAEVEGEDAAETQAGADASAAEIAEEAEGAAATADLSEEEVVASSEGEAADSSEGGAREGASDRFRSKGRRLLEAAVAAKGTAWMADSSEDEAPGKGGCLSGMAAEWIAAEADSSDGEAVENTGGGTVAGEAGDATGRNWPQEDTNKLWALYRNKTMTQAQIAAALGRSSPAVRARLREIRKGKVLVTEDGVGEAGAAAGAVPRSHKRKASGARAPGLGAAKQADSRAGATPDRAAGGARLRTHWTQSETNQLSALRRSGIHPEDIANTLGRSRSAVDNRLRQIRNGEVLVEAVEAVPLAGGAARGAAGDAMGAPPCVARKRKASVVAVPGLGAARQADSSDEDEQAGAVRQANPSHVFASTEAAGQADSSAGDDPVCAAVPADSSGDEHAGAAGRVDLSEGEDMAEATGHADSSEDEDLAGGSASGVASQANPTSGYVEHEEGPSEEAGRHYAMWTTEATAELWRLHRKGESNKWIAQHMDRKEGAIRNRLFLIKQGKVLPIGSEAQALSVRKGAPRALARRAAQGRRSQASPTLSLGAAEQADPAGGERDEADMADVPGEPEEASGGPAFLAAQACRSQAASASALGAAGQAILTGVGTDEAATQKKAGEAEAGGRGQALTLGEVGTPEAGAQAEGTSEAGAQAEGMPEAGAMEASRPEHAGDLNETGGLGQAVMPETDTRDAGALEAGEQDQAHTAGQSDMPDHIGTRDEAGAPDAGAAELGEQDQACRSGEADELDDRGVPEAGEPDQAGTLDQAPASETGMFGNADKQACAATQAGGSGEARGSGNAPVRVREPWTDAERERVQELHMGGKSNLEIALELKRTEHAIKSQLRRNEQLQIGSATQAVATSDGAPGLPAPLVAQVLQSQSVPTSEQSAADQVIPTGVDTGEGGTADVPGEAKGAAGVFELLAAQSQAAHTSELGANTEEAGAADPPFESEEAPGEVPLLAPPGQRSEDAPTLELGANTEEAGAEDPPGASEGAPGGVSVPLAAPEQESQDARPLELGAADQANGGGTQEAGRADQSDVPGMPVSTGDLEGGAEPAGAMAVGGAVTEAGAGAEAVVEAGPGPRAVEGMGLVTVTGAEAEARKGEGTADAVGPDMHRGPKRQRLEAAAPQPHAQADASATRPPIRSKRAAPAGVLGARNDAGKRNKEAPPAQTGGGRREEGSSAKEEGSSAAHPAASAKPRALPKITSARRLQEYEHALRVAEHDGIALHHSDKNITGYAGVDRPWDKPRHAYRQWYRVKTTVTDAERSQFPDLTTRKHPRAVDAAVAYARFIQWRSEQPKQAVAARPRAREEVLSLPDDFVGPLPGTMSKAMPPVRDLRVVEHMNVFEIREQLALRGLEHGRADRTKSYDRLVEAVRADAPEEEQEQGGRTRHSRRGSGAGSATRAGA